MMAAANGIAARARAFSALSTSSVTGLACIALASLLTACGGGGAPDDPTCVQADSVQLPGAGNVLSIQVRNPGAVPLRLHLVGRVTFDGAAAGAAGGYSTLVLTDGQSPVAAGTIQAPPGSQAQGAQNVAADVLLQPGTSAMWHLAHAPLPAPYGWASMTFGAAQLCIR